MLAPLTVERARELLSFDPTTGEVRWRVNKRPRAKADGIAGCAMSNGYRKLSVDGREYLVHRVAWLIVTGEWPECEIDHINGDPSDNRLDNLREATRAENCQNLAWSGNAAGAPGVSFCKANGLWHAQITIRMKNEHLGYFASKDAAAEAYRAAKAELHTFQPEVRAA